MEKLKFKTVDDYFDAQTEVALVALLKLRKNIIKYIPGAVDCIYYQIPAVMYKGKPLVAYAAFKNHCSFYIMSMKTAREFQSKWNNVVIKGVTIHFDFKETIPPALLKHIITVRMKEADVLIEKRKRK